MKGDEPGSDSPTLLIRLAVNAGLGASCDEHAERILTGVMDAADFKLLDSQWSHHPDDWRRIGGWGREHLTASEREFIRGATAALTPDANPLATELLAIIHRLTGPRPT